MRRAGLLAGLLAGVPVAHALDIVPSVQVGAVYTDNLRLTPENEDSDFVYRADPRIDISHASQRINLALDYTYSYLKFQDAEEGDASFSQGSAFLDLTLIKDAFYLETDADITQQLIDPEDGVWYTNVPIVDSRTDETRLETSPHLDTEILGVNVDARYVLGTVRYDTDEIQDVDYQETHAAITGDERGRGLSWGVYHDYQQYEYETPPDSKSQLAYLTLTWGFRESGDTFLFGSLGRESSYEDFTSADLDENYWLVGVRRQTSRTLLEVAYGDRSFGSTVRVRVRRELNRGSVELNYREDPSVEEQLFEQRPRLVTGPDPEAPTDIDRPGLGDRFVYQLASAILIKELGRNTIEFVAYHEKRDQIIDRDPDSAPEDIVQDSERELGASGSITRQFGRRTSAGLQGELANREFRTGNDDWIGALRLFGAYELGERLTLEAWVARYEQRGSEIESENYKETQAGLSANYAWR